jgi:DNA-binding transcriptional regulator YiaG
MRVVCAISQLLQKCCQGKNLIITVDIALPYYGQYTVRMQVKIFSQADLVSSGIYNPDMTRKSGKAKPKQGNRLAELRTAAGLSQRQLARLLGMTHTNISFWERSDKPPRSDVLPKMAEILGVCVQDLIGKSPVIERISGPTGKAREVFERVSRLPRGKRERVIEVVDALVKQFEQER